MLSRRSPADPTRRSSPNPRLFIVLRTLLRSERTQLSYNKANPHSFDKTPGVGVPLRVLLSCTDTQRSPFVSSLFATLAHSMLRKSFPCRSYANTRDRGATPPPKSFSPLVYPERLWRRATRPSPLALTPFRINTCKSVSKQTTLTSFRINTYEKHRGEEGRPVLLPPSYAPRNASIPCALTRLRILPVARGVSFLGRSVAKSKRPRLMQTVTKLC